MVNTTTPNDDDAAENGAVEKPTYNTVRPNEAMYR